MADPLSVAASVAGLLQLSDAVYKTLTDFTSKVERAPKSAYSFLQMVTEMRLALSSMSELVDNFQMIPARRKALLQLDHLIIVLTQAVITFTDMELFLSNWPKIAAMPNSTLKRIRWALQDDKANRIIRRLQENKASVTMVLSIIHCDSDFEAQRSREILHLSMERLVLENQQMRDLVGQLQSDIQTMAGSIRIPNDSDTATIRAGTIISEMDSLMPSEDRYNTPLSYGGRVQRSSTGSMSERQLGNLSPPGMLARPYHLLTTALVSTQENCTDSGTNDFSHTIDGGADSVSNPLDILGSPIGIAISTEHGNAEEATLTRIESNTHVSRKRPILYPTESMDQESFRESGFINRQTTNHKRPKTIERAWPLSPTSPNTFYEDSTSEIIQTTESSSSLTEQTTSLYAVNRPFEDILDSSWVYMRVWNRRTDESLTSSRLQSRARSLFSGISLSQVSSVSLFCLPISMSDIPISCHKWYTPSKELRPIVMEEVGRNYNIVVIGPAISGKSTLINKVIELVNYSAGMSHMLTISQQFCSINDNTSTPTLEDRHFLSVIVDDIKSSVELVDTSGYFDTYRVLIENAIREADAVVITCPADSATCIPDIKVFYSLLKRDMPVSIVMTKTDTVTQDRLRYLTHEIRRETAVLPQCTNYQYSIMSDKKSDNHFRDLIRTIRPKIPVKSTSLLGWD